MGISVLGEGGGVSETETYTRCLWTDKHEKNSTFSPPPPPTSLSGGTMLSFKYSMDEDVKSCLIYHQTGLRENPFRYRYLHKWLWVPSCSSHCPSQAHQGSRGSYISHRGFRTSYISHRGFRTSYISHRGFRTSCIHTVDSSLYILHVVAQKHIVDQKYLTSHCTVMQYD